MPRRTRMYLPGHAYHVFQRGNNREATFIDPEDYQLYLDMWQAYAQRYKVAVHAYCLMTNHIHFLATPTYSSSLSNVFKVVGSRYAFHINKKYNRSGTLWEGRHKSSLVQNSKYLLSCYRYIELNPVRAGLVNSPGQYIWSSHGSNAWGDISWITVHSDYMSLGTSYAERQVNYRRLFENKLDNASIELIHRALHYCQPVADDCFRQHIESKYGIKLGQMKRGRPPKRVD